jgi:hypothetical protein
MNPYIVGAVAGWVAAMSGRPVLRWAMVLGLQGVNAVTGLADLVDEVRQEREVQSAERDVALPT